MHTNETDREGRTMHAFTIDTEDIATMPTMEGEAAGTWNGWAVPVVTGGAFAAWVRAMHDSDRNGTWTPSGVTVRLEDGALQYDDDEHDTPDVWAPVGTTPEGERLYALTGWTWVKVDADVRA